MTAENTVYKTLIILFLIFSTSSYAQNNRQAKYQKAESLVKQLGAKSYKDRKKAILELIKLGYYARKAVQSVLSSSDPEISENAAAIWKEIRWAITPVNPQIVNAFISNLEKKKASARDWQRLVSECGADALDIIMVIESSDLNIEAAAEDEEIDPFGDDPFGEEEPDVLTLPSMFQTVVNSVPEKELIDKISTYEQKRRDRVYAYIKAILISSSPFTQRNLLILAGKIITPEKVWQLFDNVDFSSRVVRASLSPKAMDYIFENYKGFSADQYFKSLLILSEHNRLEASELNNIAGKRKLSEANELTAKIFYFNLEKSLNDKVKSTLLENGKAAWQKYQQILLAGKFNAPGVKEQFQDKFNGGSSIIEFIEHNIPMWDARSVPFYMMASELDNNDLDWFLYSTSTNLMRYYHRIGNYEKAQKFLQLYNEEEERSGDTNSTFYKEQANLIKKETAELLKKASSESKPEKILELLNKAEKLNPDILTIMIQKAETLVKLKRIKDAEKVVIKAMEITPDNLIEIRDLVYICWDLQDGKTANLLIDKLSLDDDSYNSTVLASQSYEFFMHFDKAHKLQEQNGLEAFGLARKLFYGKKFSEILPFCKNPDEGDFQFLWGIMAARAQSGVREAKNFAQGYQFEDNWAEIIGMTLAGRLTPEELIAEAKSSASMMDRRGRLTEAYFYAACCYTQGKEKDLKKAIQYLEACRSIKFRDYYEYVSANVMLSILKKEIK